MPAFTASADLPIELIVVVSGSYSPPDPSVGITGITVEDVEVDDIYYESRKFIPATADKLAHFAAPVQTSILSGVDVKNPEVRKLVANIMELIGDGAADEALIEANAE